jgi:hypothetical protein
MNEGVSEDTKSGKHLQSNFKAYRNGLARGYARLPENLLQVSSRMWPVVSLIKSSRTPFSYFKRSFAKEKDIDTTTETLCPAAVSEIGGGTDVIIDISAVPHRCYGFDF